MSPAETPSPADHDEYWKDAFDQFLPELLRFLAPNVALAVDWDRGFALENHGLAPDAIESKTGMRYPDRVYRVSLFTGESAVLFLHFEFESGRKNDFPERVVVYRMRLFLKLRERIFTLALFLDGDPKYRPNEYVENVFDNELRFRFRVVKLLDFAGRENEFLDSGDPARMLVAIKLIDLTVKDPDRRYAEKNRILRKLARAMRSEPRIRALTRFLIHGIMISRQRDRDFHAEVMKVEQEHPMPFVTIYEQEAEARGEVRGEARGEALGVLRSKRDAIVRVLCARFGEVPAQVNSWLDPIDDVSRLDSLLDHAVRAVDLPSFAQALAR